jgi:sensor histidine kinase YesM
MGNHARKSPAKPAARQVSLMKDPVVHPMQVQLLREAEETAAAGKTMRDVRLQASQTWINTHFLFNSLTLLSYTALEEAAPKTEQVAYLLSDLLRYSLRDTSTTVPLSKEFEMIDRYLSLHQMRLSDRLNTEIELDPMVRHLPVPRTILQPLVENAIVHRVESMIRAVTVRVSARRMGDHVQIEVYDNGGGMSREQVLALNEHRWLLSDPSGKRLSLALHSVVTRLENQYGSDFRLHVESAPDTGTRFCASQFVASGTSVQNHCRAQLQAVSD